MRHLQQLWERSLELTRCSSGGEVCLCGWGLLVSMLRATDVPHDAVPCCMPPRHGRLMPVHPVPQALHLLHLQVDCVAQLLLALKRDGQSSSTATNYLIQHAAGSGKSATIALTASQIIGHTDEQVSWVLPGARFQEHAQALHAHGPRQGAQWGL